MNPRYAFGAGAALVSIALTASVGFAAWPNLLQFSAILILPAVAARLLAPKRRPWPLLASAIYTVLALVRTFLAKDGEPTLVAQVSAAAIVSLGTGICGMILLTAISKRREQA